jgi:hypothetical protein
MKKLLLFTVLLSLPLFAFQHQNNADNLKAFFVALRQAIVGGDLKKAAAMTQSIFPTKPRLQAALKDGVSPDQVDKIMTLLGGFRPKSNNPREWAGLFRTEPARSEVRVHAATTEELQAYEKGGVAYNEFPGGARKLAESILKPGMTFYEVEYLEPGKDKGMKYHLIFWDGKAWCMLGPVWRAVK